MPSSATNLHPSTHTTFIAYHAARHTPPRPPQPSPPSTSPNRGQGKTHHHVARLQAHARRNVPLRRRHHPLRPLPAKGRTSRHARGRRPRHGAAAPQARAPARLRHAARARGRVQAPPDRPRLHVRSRRQSPCAEI
ncbi:hypothetical protein TPAR_03478, partial [Tolypocladium paradoxum]